MDEIWKPIPGYEKFYEVSDRGRVRSVLRLAPHKRYGACVYQSCVLKQTVLRNGYSSVKLSRSSKSKTHYVHHLVLLAFIGDRPRSAERGEIRHLDGCKQNNTVENLMYGTIRENAADRMRHAVERRSFT